MLPLIIAPKVFPEVQPTQWLKSFVRIPPSRYKKSRRISTHSSLLHNRFFVHAVNGPLTSLSLNLELALQTVDDNPAQSQDYLIQSLAQLKHLHKLFRLLQNQQSTRKQDFYAEPALREVITQHHQPWRMRYLTSAIHLEKDVQLKGNEFYFQEALACLIANAFEAYQRQKALKHVLVAAYTTADKLIIYIGDVAQGMDWFVQRMAFVKGFTSKKQGSGLGLVLAKELIEDKLHGELAMASFSKVGTLFVVSLPLKP